MQFVLGFHLIATAIFVLGSAVVGLRLLGLARRSRQAPELLLGCAILLTAVLGYGLLIVGTIFRSSIDADAIPFWLVSLTALAKISHDLGVALFILFVARVFRPGERWAHALACGAMLMMGAGLAWGAAEGSFRVETPMSPAWWLEYSIIWTYSLWLVVESLRYWRLMRRRAALGMADPMVTNRFLLWGIGSLFTFLATATASIPFFLIERQETMLAAAPAIYVGTAIAGVCSISCSYLAFLPPNWFAAHVRARATGSPA